MKTRTVAGATLFAALTIAQTAVSATPLPKLADRQPAQFSNEPPTQIGCQAKGQNCAWQPSVTTTKDADGNDIDVVVCYGKDKVVHAVKLKFCTPIAPAAL